MAAGALSPIATLILVLLTLFGALPMYKVVAEHSPHGDGSISMLEKSLSFWGGKLFVLALMGFAATGFIITITLSAADATAHIIENPIFHEYLLVKQVGVTFVLLGALAGLFLKGFKEAVGIAVLLVAVYIALNLVVVGVGFWHVAHEPAALSGWKDALYKGHSNPAMMVLAGMLLFPRRSDCCEARSRRTLRSTR